MATRAKFTVWSRTENVWGTTDVKLQPVTGGSDENDTFFKATPSGEISLNGLKPEVAASLTPGKAFYVELTEAE
jgi:hypothetical protein